MKKIDDGKEQHGQTKERKTRAKKQGRNEAWSEAWKKAYDSQQKKIKEERAWINQNKNRPAAGSQVGLLDEVRSILFLHYTPIHDAPVRSTSVPPHLDILGSIR